MALAVSRPQARRARLTGALAGARAHAVALEFGAVVVALVVAFGLRWPELMVAPRFTDELREVVIGHRIAVGQVLPLTNWKPHIGALFNYLVAATALVVGPKLEVGRLVVATLGALTVVPTYLLGRSLGGPLVGLLSALLLAASAVHIAVNSHVAYSHSLVPLFSTTGLWLVQRAVAGRSWRSLVAAGAAFGLAFQAHPSAIVIWPGVGLYLLWQRRRLGVRAFAAAAVAALLAIANELVFNASNGWVGLFKARDRSEAALDPTDDPFAHFGWPGRLLSLLYGLARALAGRIAETPQPAVQLDPTLFVYGGLVLAGLVLFVRRDRWLPALAMLAGLLMISAAAGTSTALVPNARHFALLLPIAYVAVAQAVVAAAHRASARGSRPWVTAAFGVVVAAALLMAPLEGLRSYYAEVERDGRTNRPVLQALAAIEQASARDETVYLDDDLSLSGTISGGRLLASMDLALEIEQRPRAIVDAKNARLINRPRDSRILVLHPDTIRYASQRYLLEPLPGEPGPGAPLRVFRASRL